MATSFQLDATADGTRNSWGLGAGASKWQAVSDASDTTYIRENANPDRQSFVMEDLPGEAAVISGDITVHYRGIDVNVTPDTLAGMVYYSGSDYDTAAQNLPTSWSDRNPVLSDLGGTAWTPTIVNASEAGVYRTVFTANDIRVSEVWLAGDYELAPGGYAYLLNSLVGGLLGSQIVLGMMPRIAALASTVKLPGKGRSWIQPEDYERAWRELVDFRRPVHMEVALG